MAGRRAGARHAVQVRRLPARGDRAGHHHHALPGRADQRPAAHAAHRPRAADRCRPPASCSGSTIRRRRAASRSAARPCRPARAPASPWSRSDHAIRRRAHGCRLPGGLRPESRRPSRPPPTRASIRCAPTPWWPSISRPAPARRDAGQANALRTMVAAGRRAQRDEFVVVSDGSGGPVQQHARRSGSARACPTPARAGSAPRSNRPWRWVPMRSSSCAPSTCSGVNNCPTYNPATTANPNEAVMPGFGCANAYNMGQMLARPRDAVVGRSPGPADATVNAAAIARYREGKVRALDTQRHHAAAHPAAVAAVAAAQRRARRTERRHVGHRNPAAIPRSAAGEEKAADQRHGVRLGLDGDGAHFRRSLQRDARQGQHPRRHDRRGAGHRRLAARPRPADRRSRQRGRSGGRRRGAQDGGAGRLHRDRRRPHQRRGALSRPHGRGLQRLPLDAVRRGRDGPRRRAQRSSSATARAARWRRAAPPRRPSRALCAIIGARGGVGTTTHRRDDRRACWAPASRKRCC